MPETGKLAELRFGHGDIDFSRVHVGDKLWKTSDPELDRRLRQSFAGDAPRFQRPIEIEVHGLAGKPLTLIARDELGHVAKVESAMPLAKAEKQPLTTKRLREQLGRLGGTPFKLGELKNFLTGEVMLPVSELNRLRREVVAELEKLRAQPKRWTTECGGRSVASLGSEISRSRSETRATPHSDAALIVLVRNLPQLEAALKCGVTTVYCEFEDPKKYREAVTLFHTARGCRNRPSTVDPQSGHFRRPAAHLQDGRGMDAKQVRSCDADGYLVRNYDHLKFFANDRRIGDYSLNVANRLAADYFKNQFGLERVTASYDLNFSSSKRCCRPRRRNGSRSRFTSTCRCFTWSTACSARFCPAARITRNCGRPCDKHDVKLRDRVGAEHPLKADAGCRNTVFNALAQTGAEYVARMLALGVRHFRVEFLNETPEQVDADDCQIPPAPARRNHRHATLARIETVQPARRHARADGKISRLGSYE